MIESEMLTFISKRELCDSVDNNVGTVDDSAKLLDGNGVNDGDCVNEKEEFGGVGAGVRVGAIVGVKLFVAVLASVSTSVLLIDEDVSLAATVSLNVAASFSNEVRFVEGANDGNAVSFLGYSSQS
mmetsp:Transcript_854/g.1508  ORF Transcript_854/g.1508 Transcript_854/m.1508 type:complete len:126 (+) Transcript_854:3136-3513(+)